MDQFEQNKKIQQDLEKTIKTGNFTAEQAKQYNQMTGNQQGARNLALTSQPAVINDNGIKTAVTQQEAQMMKDSGITKVDKQNITADQTTQQENFDALNPVGTKTEDIKYTPTTEKTKVTTQNTPTGTIKTTETPATSAKIENIDQYKKAGGGLSNLEQLVENRYGTIATQNPDGSLTADINGEKFKWTIDSKGNPVKTSLGKVETTNPEGIYQTLVAGGQVEPNSQGYKEALTRFNSYNKYKDFTDSQFQTAFTEGLILPGTQIYNDLAKNPKVKLQMDKANALNRVNGEKVDENKVFENQSEEIGNNTKVNINGQTTTLKSALEDGYISQSEYNKMTNTSEVIAKTKEIEVLKNKVDELQSVYDNVRLEVEEELKGTGANTSDYESLIGEKQRKMLGGLNLAMSKYNNAIGTLTELKKASSEQFATNLSLYNQQQARQYQLEDRKYSEDLQTKQLEQRYAYENGDLNSTNPTLQNIAIQNAVESMYKNYPIPGMESQSIKVQKIKDLIAKGMSGTQAISQVENEIRNSQRYKDYLANEKAKITPQNETKYGFDNVGNGVIAVTDPKTGNVTFKTADGKTTTPTPVDLLNAPDGSLIKGKYGVSETMSEEGMQCGEYVNKITGLGLGDTLQSKLGKMETKATNSYEPIKGNIGDVAVWVPDPTNKTFAKYGHTGIITADLGDSWEIKSANLNGDGRITTDKVPKQSIMGVSGNYDKTKIEPKGDVDEYFNVLFNSLPGGSKDNAGEVKRIKEASQKYMDEGLTPQQALLKFKGYKLNDNVNSDLALEYINIGDNLGKDKPASYETTVAKYINNGDLNGLNTYINRLADQNVSSLYKTDAILSADYNNSSKRTNEIITLINNNRDKIGAFDGRVNDLIQKFKDTPDYQKIKTLLQMSQADMRKYFAGSAVTETEMEALKDFIGGSSKMSAGNLIDMLSEVQANSNNVYKEQRNGLLIPGADYNPTQTPTTPTNTPTQYKANNGKVYEIKINN